jgi:hypothetical protein
MSKSKPSGTVRQNEAGGAEIASAAELGMLAKRIDDLVSTTGLAALEAAMALAAAPDASDLDRARKLADDIAERSSRLEQDIGRTLLSARID